MKNSLLVEKYRPTNIDNYVGNENIKNTISQYLGQNDIQNLLFYGPAGTGKTTLAKLIVKNLDCDHLYINASDERGIDTIRAKVTGFASTMSFKPLKVIILDEADFLTIQAQASLRNVIETFSRSTRFIMTCNFIERIIDPLQSRCQTLKVVPPNKVDILKHLVKIIKREEIYSTEDDLRTIVDNSYPDVRKMLNTIQVSTVDNKLNLDTTSIVSSNYNRKILAILKTKDSAYNKYKNIRQIIADANVSDFEELYRYLFDNASLYAPNNEGMVAIHINDYSYQSNFRIDKEINAMALIAKLIELT
jgi:replication factor C small subunit|tara:strand:- start:2003 stop:2917 length:915 start_codon:yes stop_codon:yes gene_type:complete